MLITYQEVLKKYGIPENIGSMILKDLKLQDVEYYNRLVEYKDGMYYLNIEGVDYLLLKSLQLGFDDSTKLEMIESLENRIKVKEHQLDLLYSEYTKITKKIGVGKRSLESIINGELDDRTFREKWFGLLED